MDPDATLQDFIVATVDGDLDAAAYAANDYQTWIDKGGFPATLDTSRGEEWVLVLDVEQDRIGISQDRTHVERWIFAYQVGV